MALNVSKAKQKRLIKNCAHQIFREPRSPSPVPLQYSVAQTIEHKLLFSACNCKSQHVSLFTVFDGEHRA